MFQIFFQNGDFFPQVAKAHLNIQKNDCIDFFRHGHHFVDLGIGHPEPVLA
jgi:hypothetical protein